MNIFDGNYWSSFKSDAENANAFYPRLSSNSLQADAPVWNGSMSDHWLFNGRYFRMKNITVGWTLPKAWMEKVHMRSARLYVSGNDLFSIDQYPKGWDPETPVVDKVPVTSSVIFGLQVNF